jgi:hypothetical protein
VIDPFRVRVTYSCCLLRILDVFRPAHMLPFAVHVARSRNRTTATQPVRPGSLVSVTDFSVRPPVF